MSYPLASNLLSQFKVRILEAATSSTAGRPVNVTVPFRSKYLATMVSLSGEASQSAAGAIDIFFYPGAILSTGAGITATVISSGMSITTSTGSETWQSPSTATGSIFSAGDILTVAGSTLVAYNVVHILQEF